MAVRDTGRGEEVRRKPETKIEVLEKVVTNTLSEKGSRMSNVYMTTLIVKKEISKNI